MILSELADYNVKFGNEQNSVRDQEYQRAVESGDTATAQRMVDEAAAEAGYNIKVYHGTANGGHFTIFDPAKLNNSTLSSHIGQGFYFTNSKSGAKEYTSNMDAYGRLTPGKNKHLFEGYLKLTNPLNVTSNSHNVSVSDATKIIMDGQYEWFLSRGIAHELKGKAGLSEQEIAAMTNEQKARAYAEYLYRGGDMAILSNLVRAYSFDNQGELLQSMKEHLGKDGIVWEMRDDLIQYVAFESSQFKESDPVTYDDNGNVIPLSERFNTENQDIRYSVRDNNYKRAVDSGNMETAQRMVDERAEETMGDSMIRDEDGNLLKVYHGTDADFTVFDMNKGRSNMDIQGAFFSPWDIDAEGYGPNVRAFYLDIKNPAPENVAYRALNAHKGQNGAGRMAREDLIRMGYDGVNNGNEEFIAFYPEQIKSADAVTHDDNGNVIPLSERFNESNPDIRFSVRQDTAIDTREYLNNLDPNDIENVKNKELLQKYQKMYRALQEAEKRRQDLQNKLNAADGIAAMNVIRSHLISAEKKVQSLREALNKFERESAFSATVRQAEDFAKDVVAKGSERALQELAEAQRRHWKRHSARSTRRS